MTSIPNYTENIPKLIWSRTNQLTSSLLIPPYMRQIIPDMLCQAPNNKRIFSNYSAHVD